MARGEASYVQIERAIWGKRRFSSLSDNGKFLFLYLVSCPHANQGGLYRIPQGYACEDLQWTAEKYRKALEELIEVGLIKYDPEHQIVFDPHQMAKFPPQNGNQVTAIIGKLKELPTTRLFQDMAKVAQAIERSYIQPLIEWLHKGSPNTPGNSSDNSLPNEPETTPQGLGERYGNPGTGTGTGTGILMSGAKSKKIQFNDETGAFENTPEALIQKWTEAYPAININTEIRKAEAWVISNPKKKKSNWSSFLTNWMKNAQDHPTQTGGKNGSSFSRDRWNHGRNQQGTGPEIDPEVLKTSERLRRKYASADTTESET